MQPHTEVTNPIKAEATHSDLEALQKHFLSSGTHQLKVEGWRNNSDIKWNAMEGEFRFGDIFRALIHPFTGNCGIKAISHLYFYKSSKTKESYTQVLDLLEDFLWHHCNAGILVGSDTTYGRTLQILRDYSAGWVFCDPVWNPNYTWDKSHQVICYHKVLKGPYPKNYFGNITHHGT